jgi:hypothetical protein
MRPKAEEVWNFLKKIWNFLDSRFSLSHSKLPEKNLELPGFSFLTFTFGTSWKKRLGLPGNLGLLVPHRSG